MNEFEVIRNEILDAMGRATDIVTLDAGRKALGVLRRVEVDLKHDEPAEADCV